MHSFNVNEGFQVPVIRYTIMVSITLTKICKVVENHTFQTLGTTLYLATEDVTVNSLQKYYFIDRVKINPAMCGPVAPIFDRIECIVHVSFASGKIFLRYAYDYHHPNGGHNGFIRDFIIPLPE